MRTTSDAMSAPGTARLYFRHRLVATLPLAAVLSLVVAPCFAATESPTNELLELSLEELVEIEVTTVSGASAQWFSSPAALTVITAEDIRRSGHQSLADVLRLVPGMFVGQASSSFWKAGARGLTAAALPAPRNLVLIDGRTVYDPLFGGVFWDVQDVLLEDIDRIEVIRGPGATLWGPNAVNGVINVITKQASETQSTLVKGGGGTYYRGLAAARHGGALGENAWFRAYLKYFARDDFDPPSEARDDWSMLRGGFRIDGVAPLFDYTVQGDLYDSLTLGSVRRDPVPDAHLQFQTERGNDKVKGGNALGRIGKRHYDGSGWSLQAYYDRTERDRVDGFAVERDTYDLDFRHVFRWLRRHETAWGVGYRATADRTVDSIGVRVNPGSATFHLGSAFLQNTSEVIRNRLFFMAGSKLTYFSETQWELQPGGRLWWTPNPQHTLWAAVSRPIRQPTRLELDGDFILAFADSGLVAGGPPSGMFVPLGISGSDDLDSERLASYEIGYRFRYQDLFTFDTAAFYNDYSDLISPPPNQIGSLSNAGDGESYGVENEIWLQPLPMWQLEFVYSFLQVEQSGPVLQFEDENFAQHMARGSSSLDITDELELNVLVYYVDRVTQGDIPSYVRFDLGARWWPDERVELALWGQDLLHDGHQEASQLEYPRGVYAQGTFRF